GGGADIFGLGDSFHYVYTTKTGDFDVTMRVPYQDAGRFTAKAGFEVRTGLDPFSPQVAVAIDPPGNIVHPSGVGNFGRSFVEGTARATNNSLTFSWGNNTILAYSNAWIRMRRVGNTFLRYSSANGTNWLFDGQVSPIPAFPSTVYFGLAVCAAQNNVGHSVQLDNYGAFSGYPLAAITKTSEPATTTTVAAGSVATISGLVATLTGGGAPSTAGELSYLWQGTNSATGGWTNMPTAGATNNALVVGTVWFTDNNMHYRAIISAPGVANSVTSAVARLTVTDTAVPTVTSVGNQATNAATGAFPAMQGPVREILITFSEPMSATALNPANYVVTNASGVVPIESESFLHGDPRTVVIVVANALGAGVVGVVINGVTDANGNAVAANTTRVFRSFPAGKGPVVQEFYNPAIAGAFPSNITTHAAFTSDQPTFITYSNTFAWNGAGGAGPGDNYGVKAYTYFVPPTNGQYKFWVRSDDGFVLFLNTNLAGNPIGSTNPLGKVLIASNGVNAAYTTGLMPTTATNITLVGGQKYYMEAILKEGGGSDFYSVMWTDSTSSAAPAATVMMPTFALEYPTEVAPYTPVRAELYTGLTAVPLGGTSGAQLNYATNFPANNYSRDILNFKYLAGVPDQINYYKTFGWQPGLQQSGMDNYLGKISAYFVPTNTGNHKFWIRSDDASALFMNTNATDTMNPSGKKRLGGVDVFTAAYTLIAQNVFLTAGEKYYIEALWREGTGGDGVAVAVRPQSDTGTPNITQSGTTGIEMIPASQLLPIDPPRAGAVKLYGIAGATTVKDGDSTTLLAQVLGGSAPFNFYWLKNGVRVLDNAITNYTPRLTMADNGAIYTVVATNGFSSATQSVTITVTADNTQPTLVSCRGFRYGDGFSLLFSEPVDPVSATFLGNYQISGGLQILSATIDPRGTLVTFQTSPQALGSTYTVTINGVKDVSSSANTIAANTIATFSTWIVGGNNAFMVEVWTNIGGSTIIDLTGQPKFLGNQPDLIWYTNQFGYGLYNSDSGLDNFGARISGYFVPTNTGYFRFYMRSDDQSQFFMNVNGANTEDPAGRNLLIYVTGANQGYTNVNSASQPVFLTSGQRYYMEALIKEGGGGDYVQVAFRPTDADGTSLTTPINPTTAAGVGETNFNGAVGGGIPGNPDILQITGFPPTTLTVGELDPVTFALVANIPQHIKAVGFMTWQRF
ncbi:MAG TPA: PA14 domain-containing protein, partial [Candidatus Acidoferrum sp.]|nr:PA14 domain-containing protein [Candidatus Acidoferrum sp.]